MRFAGKKAVITGAASGIGRATVQRLVAEGGTAFAVDMNRSALQAAFGGNASVFCHVADVTEPDSVQHLVAEAERAMGRIDILVNVVGGSIIPGYGVNSRVEDLSPVYWDRVHDLNSKSSFLCCQAALPVMKRQGYGRIVNLSSKSARTGDSFSNSAYAAAKAGVILFSRWLAHKAGPFGVTCNVVAPGLTLTERVQDNVWSGTPDERRAQILSKIPLRRLAEVEDQAAAILFLASDDARMITGQVIDVNGGEVMAS